MAQYATFVDTLTIQAEDVANQILSSDRTQHWIESGGHLNKSIAERMLLNASMEGYLSSISLNHSNIVSISLYNDDAKSVVGIGDIPIHQDYRETDWYINFKEKGTRWVSAHKDPYQPRFLRKDEVNSLLLPAVFLKSFEEKGVIKVNFPTNVLQEPIDKERGGFKEAESTLSLVKSMHHELSFVISVFKKMINRLQNISKK